MLQEVEDPEVIVDFQVFTMSALILIPTLIMRRILLLQRQIRSMPRRYLRLLDGIVGIQAVAEVAHLR